MKNTLLYCLLGLIPAICLGQTEIFNYKKALLTNRTLNVNIQSLNKVTGEVVFTGADSRGPTTPGLTFTWIWGDGTSTNGFFPQTKKYADLSKNYLAKLVAHYSSTEKDTVEVLVTFINGKIARTALDPKLGVYIPNQPIAFDNSHGNFQKVILPPFPEKFFTDVSRADFEYLMQLGATIEFDFLNGNVALYQGKFEQYMFRDSMAGGAYSLWFTRPVSFGSGDGFMRGVNSDFSSLYHEMGHNLTLNFPGNFIFGGKIDGNANAIYSETMAQIFQYSVGYEIINNYQAYGLDEVFLAKYKTNFFNGIVNLRKNYADYVRTGMPFSTWNDPATPGDEALLTFLTTAYKFYEYAEQQNIGYRTPIKRLTQFLSRFNAEWQQRYDQYNNTPAGQAFRATMMVAALSHAFQKDLRADFRALNFSISDADWAFLNPQILDVSASTLAIGASAGSTATFAINSNVNWTVGGSESWLAADISSGNNTKTVTLTASANPGVASRTAQITIAAIGLESKSITVTQAGAAPTLSVSNTTLSIDAPGSDKPTISLTSNTTWTARSSQAWLSISPGSGTGNQTLTVTAMANVSVNPRSATLVFAASDTGEKTVNVTQAGAVPMLTVSISTLNLDFAPGSSAAFDVTSNTDWTVSSTQSWLTVTPGSATGNSKVTITASLNPLPEVRKATVTLRANGVADKFVEVSQAAGPITSLTETSLSGISVFPNPVSDWVMVDGLPANSQITLYKADGMLLETASPQNSAVSLPMKGVSPGLYLLRVQAGDFFISKKILKLH